jgi:photosystem II stability/assembly factor-like uncharacterized protein
MKLRNSNKLLAYSPTKQKINLQLLFIYLMFVPLFAQEQQWQPWNESSKGEEHISKLTGKELSKSMNSENGWSQIFNGTGDFYVHDIKISSSNPSIIYAAGSGVYQSTDRGVSWDSIGENSFLLIGVDPLNSEVVLGISSTPVLNNIYRTTNGGKKWDYLLYHNPTYISFFVFDRSEPEAVYSALTQGKLNRSFDYGTTWGNVNLPDHPGGTLLYSLAIPNDDPNLLYISAKYGVYKSTDRGEKWDSLNISTDGNYNELFLDPINSQTLYVVIKNKGVFKSTDGGKDWIEKNDGLINLNFSSYVSLVINPENAEEIYLAADSVLYQSINGGDKWNLMEPTPPMQKIYTIALDTNSGNRILIGGNIPGIYALDLITSVEEPHNQQLPSNIELSQNYPNPFNPTTTIKYTIHKNGFVTIKVFNLLGQEVTVLVNKEQKAGNYNIEFNASNLASGVYLYEIQAGNYSLTKKMVLLR